MITLLIIGSHYILKSKLNIILLGKTLNNLTPYKVLK